ncbi:Crp/Fnr family transcriptional regulator [Bacillus sp. Marseille-P3661]|uniref:Crp/Fnr family transcriptional regulator n=1 Tax=Bacillus sp. Marseille-P3661 TaxID=1936234 RepID=UPI000C82C404|nr:Crp/Fnr family transcriptional regulator [Bacillus sp. Marseille-P3661]
MCCTANCNHNVSCFSIVPVFQGMNTKDLTILQSVTKSRCYKKGEFIFREGERSETLFIINSGLIKFSKVSEEGKEQILRLLFKGDFFGQFALLQNEDHYADAEALDETIICSIDKKFFLDTLKYNPTMAVHFINALNNRLFHADEWMSLLSLMDVEQRLARVLLLFYEKLDITNNQFTLPITKRDLASLIGTTPETLSRKLVAFSAQQLISLKQPRAIQVVNFDQLKLLAGQLGERAVAL